nr:hypothetical protein [Burkholderia ambifaria]
MDYYQGIVTDYLRADRATFINTECCIQLNPGANPDQTGPHWYCDAVAVDLREEHVFLCEISYATGLSDLAKRLLAWKSHWPALRAALVRDLCVNPCRPVTPWAFILQERTAILELKIAAAYSLTGTNEADMPYPKITALEDVVPWKYRSWNRVTERG